MPWFSSSLAFDIRRSFELNSHERRLCHDSLQKLKWKVGKLRLEVGTFYRLISSKLFTSLASTWIFWRGSLRKGVNEAFRVRANRWWQLGIVTLVYEEKGRILVNLFSSRSQKIRGRARDRIFLKMAKSKRLLFNQIDNLVLTCESRRGKVKISHCIQNPGKYGFWCETTNLTSLIRSSANLHLLQSL